MKQDLIRTTRKENIYKQLNELVRNEETDIFVVDTDTEQDFRNTIWEDYPELEMNLIKIENGNRYYKVVFVGSSKESNLWDADVRDRDADETLALAHIHGNGYKY